MTVETYDFIVVGAGPAGSALASRLADTSSSPKVLLLEAGGTNDAVPLRSSDSRWSVAFTEPLLDWGYKSMPQSALANQEIPLARGKGLGGSSAINFACWLYGHKEDFNEWAERVGDSCWSWENVLNRFEKVERMHVDLNEMQAKYLDQKALNEHSKKGRVDLTFNKDWPALEWMAFEAAKEMGIKVNGDLNSGDPTGLGISPSTFYKGSRVTASTAYLFSPPKNLTILTDSEVARIILDSSNKATGVETISGKTYHATKEVILSAGTFNSPKILLLSGIGPRDQLSQLSIPVKVDLPGVGDDLRDHSMLATTILLKLATPDLPPVGSLDGQQNPVVARDPLFYGGPQCPMGWISSAKVKSSEEFNVLDKGIKDFLSKVPSFEMMVTNVPLTTAHLQLGEDATVVSFICAVMNPQSSGSVKLSSADPKDPPIIDPNYCSHPYDRRVAIEATRALMKYARQPVFAEVTDRFLDGPADESDESIWEHCKKTLLPVWHFAGTCKMGKDDDGKAVVCKDFKVKGVKGLRVADVSICPVLPNNHTQSTAYLIGETLAEKIVAEYGL